MNRAAILQRLRSEAKAKQPTSTLTLVEVRSLLSIRTFVSIGPKGWSSQRLERARTRARDGHTAEEIGFALGCTAGSVRHALSRSPPTMHDCRQEWRSDRGLVVFRLRQAGLTWPVIAERMRVSMVTAQTYLAIYRASIRQAQAAK